MILVGLFALFHGHAHGTEMPETAAGSDYGLGYIVATMCLHGVGICLGVLAQRVGTERLVRYAGGAIALCGLYLYIG
jgi:urease accessory protein